MKKSLNPMLIILTIVLLAAVATYVVPSGTFERTVDAVSGAEVVVPGTYTETEKAPIESTEETEDEDCEDSNEYEDEIENEEDLSQPIGKYVDDGTTPLVQGNFEGLNVFAVIRGDKAELVINGFVCDELDVSYLNEFQLRAFVNDIDFTFDFKETESGKVMYLYADNELLDSLGLS